MITIPALRNIGWSLKTVLENAMWFKKGQFTMKMNRQDDFVKIGILTEEDKLKTYFYGKMTTMEKLERVLSKLNFN